MVSLTLVAKLHLMLNQQRPEKGVQGFFVAKCFGKEWP